ncbi:MAG: OprO/OprP family phosphate-selective porin [Muribaculaceae bacterium]|nr:OprO/OprP family phosphate-selective porin [Muribaculaceae bacterium]
MKLKRLAAAASFLISSSLLFATTSDSIQQKQTEEHLISLDVEARMDWQIVDHKSSLDRTQTGFIGKYIALKAHGQLAEGLTYTWRQRFSRTPKDNTFWDQTDILDINYKFGKFDVGAGKQIVLIGGYEYDRPPINLMCPNLFISNVACYQFGVSGGYQLTPNDHLAFQVSQSLFATPQDRNLYAYNLMWRGSHNIFDLFRLETIWSVNEIEYQKGKYCNYVALGNKFLIKDNITVLVDLMTRTYPENRIFKNNTFMGEIAWTPFSKWKFTAKMSYDCNRGVNTTDKTEVARGSQLVIGGIVAEWYPLIKARHLLKVHAAAFASAGVNNNPADLMQKDTFYGSIGLTWHMNLLNIK